MKIGWNTFHLRFIVSAFIGVTCLCAGTLIPMQIEAQPVTRLSDGRSFQQVVDFNDFESVRSFIERVPHRQLLAISRQRGPFMRGVCRSLERLRQMSSARLSTAQMASIIPSRWSPSSCLSVAPLETSFARRVCRALKMVVVSIRSSIVTCRRANMT